MSTEYADIHKDIIERCKKGDIKAQYKLYKLYSKAMYNVCLRILKTEEDAADMLQEVFTDVFIKLHTFRYESSFGAWIKRITVNKCINEIKRRKVELVYVDQYFDNSANTNENDENNQPEYSVEQIIDAMKDLPEGYRIIFSLYLFEGYTHKEIAEILGITESTSKTQYLRAKKRLKQILTKQKNG